MKKILKSVRVRIYLDHDRGSSEHFKVYDTTIEEVTDFIKDIIDKQHFSQFIGGKSTYVEMTEKKNDKSVKSKTISFRGLDPQGARKLIFKHLTE